MRTPRNVVFPTSSTEFPTKEGCKTEDSKKILKRMDLLEEQVALLKKILKKQEAIEATLRRLPEVQAATYLLMREELEAARFAGRKASDLWEVSRPNLGGSQSRDEADPPLSERP